MKQIFLLITFILFSMILSCTSSIENAQQIDLTYSNSLDEWIDDSLIPYIKNQLKNNPKLRGKPFLIVSMKDDDIEPDIDNLTLEIRNRLKDTLIPEQGIHLVWKPSVKPWKHYRKIKDVECDESQNVKLYIGLDVGFTCVNQMLYVKVRALNLSDKSWADNQWANGFGLSWRGKATQTQLAATQKINKDEYLRGLRPLPFTQSQPDLAASYLARNLSCVFRQIGADTIKVYVENQNSSCIKFFDLTMKLTKNYIAKFREIRITDNKDKADIIIKTEVHSIYNNLYMIWISAMDKKGQEYLAGAGTETYCLLEKQIQNTDITIHAETPEIYNEQQDPVIYTPIIESFKIVSPMNYQLCNSETPWIQGEKEIADNEILPVDACLAFKAVLSKSAYLMIITHDENNILTKEFPFDHNNISKFDGLFNFPTDDMILEFQGGNTKEWVYLIAVSDQNLVFEIDKSFENFQYPSQWQAYLNNMQTKNRGKFEWQCKLVQHAQ